MASIDRLQSAYDKGFIDLNEFNSIKKGLEDIPNLPDWQKMSAFNALNRQIDTIIKTGTYSDPASKVVQSDPTPAIIDPVPPQNSSNHRPGAHFVKVNAVKTPEFIAQEQSSLLSYKEIIKGSIDKKDYAAPAFREAYKAKIDAANSFKELRSLQGDFTDQAVSYNNKITDAKVQIKQKILDGLANGQLPPDFFNGIESQFNQARSIAELQDITANIENTSKTYVTNIQKQYSDATDSLDLLKKDGTLFNANKDNFLEVMNKYPSFAREHLDVLEDVAKNKHAGMRFDIRKFFNDKVDNNPNAISKEEMQMFLRNDFFHESYFKLRDTPRWANDPEFHQSKHRSGFSKIVHNVQRVMEDIKKNVDPVVKGIAESTNTGAVWTRPLKMAALMASIATGLNAIAPSLGGTAAGTVPSVSGSISNFLQGQGMNATIANASANAVTASANQLINNGEIDPTSVLTDFGIDVASPTVLKELKDTGMGDVFASATNKALDNTIRQQVNTGNVDEKGIAIDFLKDTKKEIWNGLKQLAPDLAIKLPQLEGPDVNWDAVKFDFSKFGVNGKKFDLDIGDIKIPKIDLDVPGFNIKADLPEVNIPKIDVNAPNINVPTPNITTPDINVPKVNAPDINIETPNIETPSANIDIPNPDINTPKIKTHTPDLNINTPDINTPKINTPKVDLPKVDIPKVNLDWLAPLVSASLLLNQNKNTTPINTQPVDTFTKQKVDTNLTLPEITSSPIGKAPAFSGGVIPKANLSALPATSRQTFTMPTQQPIPMSNYIQAALALQKGVK